MHNGSTDRLCPTKLAVSDAAHTAVLEIALAERLRSATTHAARLECLAQDYDVPMSTLRAAIAQDMGPRTFTIGRLIYCRRSDWTAWLDGLAEKGGTGPLSPPTGRISTHSERHIRATV